jgi:hypothetical protein
MSSASNFLFLRCLKLVKSKERMDLKLEISYQLGRMMDRALST